MPFRYKIYQEEKTIIVHADGVIDLRSSIQAMKDLVADKEFDPHFPIIVDLRKMQYDPSISDVFRIRDALVSLSRNFKEEIKIVTSKNILYLAELFCAMAKAFHLKITAVTELDVLDTYENKCKS